MECAIGGGGGRGEGGRGGLFAHVGLQVALSVRERLAGLGTVGKSASGVKCRKGVGVIYFINICERS